MSNLANSAPREISLATSKPSRVARVGPVNRCSVPHDESRQVAAVDNLPRSWTEVIENPRLWAVLREVLLDSE